MIIKLDMDGVLCDFGKYIIEHFGKPFDDFETQEIWRLISTYHPNIYRDLDKMPDADELVYGVNELATEYNIRQQVLTAIPSRVNMLQSVDDKLQWISQRYPHLKHDVTYGPYSINKQWHATIGDVLIDDRRLNISQWCSRGGIGIWHTSAASTLSQLEDYLQSIRGTINGVAARYPIPKSSKSDI